MDTLITALLELTHELPELPQPLLIGGGFGLYLKQRCLEDRDAEQTLIDGQHWPPARATEDIDLFLPTEVIVSAKHTKAIRAALDKLSYEPLVDNFQFVRQTQRGPIRIDLLAGEIPDELRDQVQIKPPRVRPIGGSGLHAYLTEEAIALGISPFEMKLRGERSDNVSTEITVHIPNPFTYLLMKLHAFRDRVNDPRKNLAAHHALDAYRIVAMLTQVEYELVVRLANDRHASPILVNTRTIIKDYFADDRGKGTLRLRTGAKDSGLAVSAEHVEEFRSLLWDVFMGA